MLVLSISEWSQIWQIRMPLNVTHRSPRNNQTTILEHIRTRDTGSWVTAYLDATRRDRQVVACVLTASGQPTRSSLSRSPGLSLCTRVTRTATGTGPSSNPIVAEHPATDGNDVRTRYRGGRWRHTAGRFRRPPSLRDGKPKLLDDQGICLRTGLKLLVAVSKRKHVVDDPTGQVFMVGEEANAVADANLSVVWGIKRVLHRNHAANGAV